MCPIDYYSLMRNTQDKKQLRYQMVVSAQTSGVMAASRLFHTTKNTISKWLKRFNEHGHDSLTGLSRRPHNSPNATPLEVQKKLVELKRKYKRLGAEQIKVLENLSISAKTMRKIWRRHGVPSRKLRKKHVTKQNLRAVKKIWPLFQQICEDTKILKDIPEYWWQMKRLNLPEVQYTARDVTTGLLMLGVADEISMHNSKRFADYCNFNLQKYGADLSHTRRQTDNGVEYIGSWQARKSSAYTKIIESVAGQVHHTIFPGAHRMQSDVETVHGLMEREFYELETFKDKEDFLNKLYSYLLFFNLARPNTYKENKTPWQLVKEKNPNLPIEIAMIPPIDLSNPLYYNHSVSKSGYDVYSNP
jgi:transposase